MVDVLHLPTDKFGYNKLLVVVDIATDEFDIRVLLRNGGTDDEIAELMRKGVGLKWAGHQINQVNFIRPRRSMSQIGG